MLAMMGIGQWPCPLPTAGFEAFENYSSRASKIWSFIGKQWIQKSAWKKVSHLDDVGLDSWKPLKYRLELPDTTPCHCDAFHQASRNWLNTTITFKCRTQVFAQDFATMSCLKLMHLQSCLSKTDPWSFMITDCDHWPLIWCTFRAARPTVITEESLGPASLAAVSNSRLLSMIF